MSRKNTSKKRQLFPDPTYNSYLVSMFINRLLQKGKKSVATKIFNEAMIITQESTDKEPLDVLREAILNVTPIIEVKSKRVGGSTYQVPKEVSSERGTALAMRWILQAAKNRPDRGMIQKLANEIIDASNQTGNAIRKKEETHKMAEANKAFAHYRF
jgi:small subunit ribosomal protein S7